MGNVIGGQILWQLDVDKGKYSAKMADARSEAADTANAVNQETSKLGDIVGGTLGKIGSALATTLKVGTVAAVAELGTLGAFGLKTGADLQKTNISIQALTGSAEVANKIFSDLYQLALKSPFAFPDIASAGKNLLALGVNAKDVVKDMTLLSNISAATGADLGTLASVFGQVTAQGRAMGQDILQLSQNGVAILPALQKELGKTGDQVRDMASQGQIGVEVFNKALASIVSGDTLALFNNTMPRAIDRLRGSLRNLALTFVGVDISNGFKAASDGLTQVAINLINQLATTLRSPQIIASVKALGAQLTGAVSQLGPLITPLINVITAIAGPLVSLISAAIGALVSLLTGALPGITAFFGALNSAFARLLPTASLVGATLGNALGSILRSLAPALTPIANALAILLPPLAQIIVLLGVSLASALKEVSPLFVPLANILGILANAFGQGLAAALIPLTPVLGQLALAMAQLLIASTPLIVILTNLAVGALTNLLVPALQATIPVITSVVTFLTSLVEGFTKAGPLVKGFAAVVGVIVGAITALEVGLNLGALAMGAFQVAAGLAAAASGTLAAIIGVVTAPFTLVVLAIAAVVAGIIFLQAKFDIFGKTLALIRPIFADVAQVFNIIGQALIGADPTVNIAPKFLAFAHVMEIVQLASLKLQEFVGKLVGAFQTAGNAIGSAMGPSLNALEGLFSRIGTSISKDLLSSLKSVISIIGPSLSAIGKAFQEAGKAMGDALGPAIKTISQAFSQQLIPAFQKIMEAVKPLIPAFKIIGLVILGIALAPFAAAVGAVVVGIKLLAEGFKFLAPVIVFIVQVFAGLFVIGVKVAAFMIGVFAGAFNVAATIINVAVGTIIAVIQGIVAAIQFVINIVVSIAQIWFKTWAFMALVVVGTLAIVTSVIVGVFQGIVAVLSPIFAAIGAFISAGFSLFYTFIVTPIASAIEAVIGIFIRVANFIGGVLVEIGRRIVAGASTVVGFFVGIFTGIFEAIKGPISQIVDIAAGIVGRITRALGNVGGSLFNAGKDLIQGFLNGAGSVLSTIEQFFLSKLPKSIQEPFKKALGIHSPSTVFAGFGKDIMLGLAQGITDNQSLVPNVDFTGSAVVAPSAVTPTANPVDTANGVTITQNNTILNPFDLNAATRELSWQFGLK